MTHLDPDQLALIALGEHETREEEFAHLRDCAHCAGELDELRGVVGTARLAGSDGPLSEPPPHVWEAVAAELRADPGPVLVREPVAAHPAALPRRRPWFTRPWVVGLAAGLAGILLGLTIGLLHDPGEDGDGDGGGEQPAPNAVIASAELSAEPGRAGDGEAVLRDTADGTRLTLRLAGLPEGDGFYEVWLIDPETGGLLSLGLLTDGETSTFALPGGVDYDRYSLVDVSLEPDDGDPTHSGDSHLRGTLSS